MSAIATLSAPAANSAVASPSTVTTPVDWPQFHMGPDHTGLNSSEQVIDASNVGGLRLKWKAPTSAAWIESSSPAVVAGIVYIGSQDGHLYAFDANTGASLWSAATGGPIESSPAVDGGVVYIGSDDHSVYAFDANTGAKLWSFATADQIQQSSPTVANGIVYIGSLDGHLYALNASNGSLKWKSPAIWKVRRSAAVANGVVYVGTDKSMLYAFNASTGASLWQASTGGMVRDTPSVANGIVYVGAEDYRLYAFNASTGALVWKTSQLPNSGAVRSSPAVANGIVYIDTAETLPMGSHVYAFDAVTGAAIWNHTMADFSVSSPAVADGVVFSASNDTQLYGFDAHTGTPIWHSGFHLVTMGITSSPAVVNGTVYVGSRDGSLYAFADLTPPSLIFDSAPDTSTTSTSASFAFHPSESLSGGVTCSLDGADPVDCSSETFTVDGLSVGSHSLSVAATDLAGNAGTTTYSWTIDAALPVLTIVRGPDGYTNSGYTNVNYGHFELSSSEPGTFQCQLDDQPVAACSSWPQYDGLADGPHTFTGWAIDLAGNVSDPQSRSWIQDTVPPTITVAGPTDIVGVDNATFYLSSTEPVSYKCSKDGGAYQDCSSPATMSSLANGTHTFSAYAHDPAWNQSNTVTVSFTVQLGYGDTTPPTLTIVRGPNGLTNTGYTNINSATFQLSSNEAGTFACQLDSQLVVACTSWPQYTGLLDGPHTFTAWAIDVASNVSAPQSRGWIQDTVPPTISVTGPSGVVNTTTVYFTLSSSEPLQYYRCSKDGAAYSSCSTPVKWGSLTNGVHTFSVYAYDLAWNLSNTVTLSFTVQV